MSSRCDKSVTFSVYSNLKLSPTNKDSCLGGKGGERQKRPPVLFRSESGVGVVRFPRRGRELGRRRGGGRKGREGKRVGEKKGKEGKRKEPKRRVRHKQRLGLIQFYGPEIRGKKVHK